MSGNSKVSLVSLVAQLLRTVKDVDPNGFHWEIIKSGNGETLRKRISLVGVLLPSPFVPLPTFKISSEKLPET